jgi:DNA-binding beta-propeller fold protein YncE
MTPWTRLLRACGAAALAALLVLSGGSGRIALANGVGDLYVADSNVVNEVYLKTSTIESPITVPAAPTMLAFTADGQTLYAADGTTDLYQIRISDLAVSGPTRAPKPITAMAHPFGASLFLALAGSSSLSVLQDGATAFIAGPTLPAAPDLLAADPRETRFAAAAKGAGWVAIVEPTSSKVIRVGGASGIGGKVVAIAIARAEGEVWVATSGPDRVALVSLASGKVVSSAPLDGAPVAITALDKFAVVAVGSSLYKIKSGAASAWATASGRVLALASDLSAQYVYVATATRVTAHAVAHPQATPAASVAMPNGAPTALAPVPNRGSSLAAAGGDATANAAAANPKSTSRPAQTHAPATDALGGVAIGGRTVDLATLLAGVGAVVLAVLVGSREVIKRLVGGP